MKGIYIVNRKDGTSVYISHTPPRQAQVRDLIEFVPTGGEFTRRVREAKKRAEKVLVKRKAAIVDGKHDPIRAPEPGSNEGGGRSHAAKAEVGSRPANREAVVRAAQAGGQEAQVPLPALHED